MPEDDRHATLKPVGGSDADAIPVQFNPASLQYQVTNTLQEQGQQGERKQYITHSTAKLTMELIFDTTHNGEDVREYTGPIAAFMRPRPDDERGTVPPVVEFRWGAYSFRGLVESFRETIDFFHGSGLPLRSTVNLVLSAQERVFESGTGASPLAPARGDAVDVPGAQGLSPAGAAAQGGDPRAGSALAAANGQSSVRFSSGPLTVSASIELKGPAGFAASGAGIGADAGLGISAGIGGSGAGFSTSFGSQASAGVAASAGAFAGIGASSSAGASFALDPRKLVASSPSAGLPTSAGASFAVGGQASAKGSLRVDLSGGSQARLIFEED